MSRGSLMARGVINPHSVGTSMPWAIRKTCGSGLACEASDAVSGTGFAGVRGQARSHSFRHRSATPHVT